MKRFSTEKLFSLHFKIIFSFWFSFGEIREFSSRFETFRTEVCSHIFQCSNKFDREKNSFKQFWQRKTETKSREKILFEFRFFFLVYLRWLTSFFFSLHRTEFKFLSHRQKNNKFFSLKSKSKFLQRKVPPLIFRRNGRTTLRYSDWQNFLLFTHQWKSR